MIAMRSGRPNVAVPFWFCTLVLLAAAGCRQGAATGDEAEHDRGRFGDPYEVVLGFASAGPDTPPALESDTLVALVTYAGGCADHDFTLRHDAEPDTARLWIYHDAHGDDCEAQVRDEVRLPVPGAVLEAPTVVLLNPLDDVPFVVRWGRAAAP